MRHPGPLFLNLTRAYSLTQTLVRLARQSYQEYKVGSLQKRSRRKQMVGTANSYPKDLMARTILRRRQAAKSSKSPLNEKASSFELAYR
jgi:predicted metalloendopeptidase